jgi:dolichol kinase
MEGCRDYFLALITLLVVLVSWGTALVMHKAGFSERLTRNFLHLVAGFWGLLWFHFQNLWIPLSLSLLAFIGLSISLFVLKRTPVFSFLLAPFASESLGKWGIVFYAFSLVAITCFFWENKSLGTAVILALSFGDGAADAIGATLGHRFYSLSWNNKKTLEGSLACFLGASLGVYAGYWIAGCPVSPVIAVLSGLICAVVEALSPSDFDNLLIPAFLSAFLLLVS